MCRADIYTLIDAAIGGAQRVLSVWVSRELSLTVYLSLLYLSIDIDTPDIWLLCRACLSVLR